MDNKVPSSMEETDPDKKSNKKGQKRTTYRGSTVQVETLKMYFGIKFCNIPSGPTPEEMIKLDISKLIDLLINFVTQKSKISAKEVIDFGLKAPGNECIKNMYTNDTYSIDLKQPCNVPNLRASCEVTNFICQQFLKDLHHVLLKTSEHSDSSTDHHDIVKQCIYRLASIISEGFLTNGAFKHTIQATKPELKSLRSANEEAKPESFTSAPDVAIGRFEHKCPLIPVEVYSPLKKYGDGENVKQKKKKTANNPSSDVESSSDEEEPIEKSSKAAFLLSSGKSDITSTDEDASVTLQKFLDKNKPPYLLSCRQSHFKHKLTAQLVLQMISAAVQYTGLNCSLREEELKKNRAFMGIFVCNEYVYIAKTVGDEITFRNFEVPASSFNKIVSSGNRGGIYVQFSPLLFDLSIHNHRMALMFFMKYYLCNWDNMDMEFKVGQEDK